MDKKGSGSNKTSIAQDGATVPIILKKGAGVPAKPKAAPKPQGK